jgi:hypothetical protein
VNEYVFRKALSKAEQYEYWVAGVVFCSPCCSAPDKGPQMSLAAQGVIADIHVRRESLMLSDWSKLGSTRSVLFGLQRNHWRSFSMLLTAELFCRQLMHWVKPNFKGPFAVI